MLFLDQNDLYQLQNKTTDMRWHDLPNKNHIGMWHDTTRLDPDAWTVLLKTRKEQEQISPTNLQQHAHYTNMSHGEAYNPTMHNYLPSLLSSVNPATIQHSISIKYYLMSTDSCIKARQNGCNPSTEILCTRTLEVLGDLELL